MGAEIDQDGFPGGGGFAQQGREGGRIVRAKIEAAENGFGRRSGGIGFRGRRWSAEGGHGVPRVVERQQQDQDAEDFLHRFHPGAGLGQDGEAGGGQRPRQGHADAQQERQREGDAHALRIQRAGQREDGDQDGRDAGAGQQRGNAAHDEHGRQARAPSQAAGLAEAREIELPNVEHRQRERGEQHGDGAVEDRRGIDRAEDGAGEHHDEPQRAVDEGHAEAVDEAEAEARGARGIGAARADDGEVDRDHRQHAGRQVEQETADQDQEDRGQDAAAEIELRGIVEEEFPRRSRSRRVRGGFEEGEERGHVGIADEAARLAAAGQRKDVAGGRRGCGRRGGGARGARGARADGERRFFRHEADGSGAALVGHDDGLGGGRGIDRGERFRIGGSEGIVREVRIRLGYGERRQRGSGRIGDGEAGVEVVVRGEIERHADGGLLREGLACGRNGEGGSGGSCERQENGQSGEGEGGFTYYVKTLRDFYVERKNFRGVFHGT